MSPHTDLVHTTSDRAPEQVLPLHGTPALDPGLAPPKMWEPPLAILAPIEYRVSSADRSALFVQITLCLVVAALLFSVIALPKIRASNTKLETSGAPKGTAHGR